MFLYHNGTNEQQCRQDNLEDFPAPASMMVVAMAMAMAL